MAEGKKSDEGGKKTLTKTKKKTADKSLRDALIMICPGTALREGISIILQSGNGGLFCLGDPKRLAELSEGGVEVNSPYTPQLLYELSKMDGAIILNENGSRILFANRFLKPDNTIPSNETGTRHRAAERIAKHAKCVVIAISERRSSVTLYVSNKRHVLESIPTLLNKSSQALQTLDKYMKVLETALADLSTREFEDMVTIVDVCKAVQRCEMVVRISHEIEPHILELGTEGRLIDLQLKELMSPIDEAELVIRDYFKEKTGVSFEQAKQRVREIDEENLLNLSNISQALGYGPNLRSIDTYLTSRGYRLLTLTRSLSPQLIDNLVARFGSLQAIMRAPKEELNQVDGIGDVLAERVRLSLNGLRNQLALDRTRR